MQYFPLFSNSCSFRPIVLDKDPTVNLGVRFNPSCYSNNAIISSTQVATDAAAAASAAAAACCPALGLAEGLGGESL